MMTSIVLWAAVALGVLAILVGYLALRAKGVPALTGTEGLIDAIGEARSSFQVGEVGSVFVQGELWSARTNNEAVAVNSPIRVLARQKMTLFVTPISTEEAVAFDGPLSTRMQLTELDESK